MRLHSHHQHTLSMRLIILIALSMIALSGSCTIWPVGAGRTYTVPGAVSGLVQTGDTVQIDAGVYNDCAVWTKSHLLLQGVGPGYAHCINAVCGSKGIWVINAGADNITIENMEFSGAAISGGLGGNGAGLRAQGGSYTIRHCYFHDNQNGILCNPTVGNDSADVLIEHSIFAYNGCANGSASGCNPGYEHNMYIGSGYRSFTLQYSYTHGAINGHNVKTRARNNYILYNRIMDLADGTSSYDIDIAQGGPTVIMGNLIEGGPAKVNHSMICYNEGSTNPGPQNLYLINNTIVNDQSTGYFLFDPLSTNDTLTLVNNIIAGHGALFNGAAGFHLIDSSHNLIDTSIAAAGLVSAPAYDYHLLPTSAAIDAGVTLGYISDIVPLSPFSLSPSYEYIDSADAGPRAVYGATTDIGAYEYPSVTGQPSIAADGMNMRIVQHPASDMISLEMAGPTSADHISVTLYDMTGRAVMVRQADHTDHITLSTAGMASGVYILRAESDQGHRVRRFVLSR